MYNRGTNLFLLQFRAVVQWSRMPPVAVEIVGSNPTSPAYIVNKNT